MMTREVSVGAGWKTVAFFLVWQRVGRATVGI